MEQDLKKLDVTKLHPLSPEVISRQATINIGNLSFVCDSLLHIITPPYTICVYSILEKRLGDLILLLKLTVHY